MNRFFFVIPCRMLLRCPMFFIILYIVQRKIILSLKTAYKVIPSIFIYITAQEIKRERRIINKISEHFFYDLASQYINAYKTVSDALVKYKRMSNLSNHVFFHNATLCVFFCLSCYNILYNVL